MFVGKYLYLEVLVSGKKNWQIRESRTVWPLKSFFWVLKNSQYWLSQYVQNFF